MKKYKTVPQRAQVVKDIICDFCGESCRDCCGINYEYSTLSASWGYCSHKDYTSWEYHFCEGCSDKIKELFKEG